MNVDLHCHSNFSDGVLSPEDVVRRAAGNGVEMLALTDHDHLGGLPAARAQAEMLGIRFVNGVEVSVSWGPQTVHIVGLGVDPGNGDLLSGLEQVRSGRDARAREMAEALAKVGAEDAYNGAMKYVSNPALIGRSHFARFLVERGYAKDTASVFEHYLVPGKPGFVEQTWATLADAVGWIHAAGGIAVIAHPARYRLSQQEITRLFESFKSLGGQGIEVCSGAHGDDEVRRFARVARQYGFLASRASDFHAPGEGGADIGRARELPAGLEPVWAHLASAD